MNNDRRNKRGRSRTANIGVREYWGQCFSGSAPERWPVKLPDPGSPPPRLCGGEGPGVRGIRPANTGSIASVGSPPLSGFSMTNPPLDKLSEPKL